MNEGSRIKIVSGIDIPVGIFLLIVGILVVIMALDMISLMGASSGSIVPLYSNLLPWIFFMLGLAAVIYGIKRTIDDILKMMVVGQQNRPQPPRYQAPDPPVDQEPPARQF